MPEILNYFKKDVKDVGRDIKKLFSIKTSDIQNSKNPGYAPQFRVDEVGSNSAESAKNGNDFERNIGIFESQLRIIYASNDVLSVVGALEILYEKVLGVASNSCYQETAEGNDKVAGLAELNQPRDFTKRLAVDLINSRDGGKSIPKLVTSALTKFNKTYSTLITINQLGKDVASSRIIAFNQKILSALDQKINTQTMADTRGMSQSNQVRLGGSGAENPNQETDTSSSTPNNPSSEDSWGDETEGSYQLGDLEPLQPQAEVKFEVVPGRKQSPQMAKKKFDGFLAVFERLAGADNSTLIQSAVMTKKADGIFNALCKPVLMTMIEESLEKWSNNDIYLLLKYYKFNKQEDPEEYKNFITNFVEILEELKVKRSREVMSPPDQMIAGDQASSGIVTESLNTGNLEEESQETQNNQKLNAEINRYLLDVGEEGGAFGVSNLVRELQGRTFGDTPDLVTLNKLKNIISSLQAGGDKIAENPHLAKLQPVYNSIKIQFDSLAWNANSNQIKPVAKELQRLLADLQTKINLPQVPSAPIFTSETPVLIPEPRIIGVPFAVVSGVETPTIVPQIIRNDSKRPRTVIEPSISTVETKVTQDKSTQLKLLNELLKAGPKERGEVTELLSDDQLMKLTTEDLLSEQIEPLKKVLEEIEKNPGYNSLVSLKSEQFNHLKQLAGLEIPVSDPEVAEEAPEVETLETLAVGGVESETRIVVSKLKELLTIPALTDRGVFNGGVVKIKDFFADSTVLKINTGDLAGAKITKRSIQAFLSTIIETKEIKSVYQSIKDGSKTKDQFQYLIDLVDYKTAGEVIVQKRLEELVAPSKSINDWFSVDDINELTNDEMKLLAEENHGSFEKELDLVLTEMYSRNQLNNKVGLKDAVANLFGNYKFDLLDSVKNADVANNLGFILESIDNGENFQDIRNEIDNDPNYFRRYQHLSKLCDHTARIVDQDALIQQRLAELNAGVEVGQPERPQKVKLQIPKPKLPNPHGSGERPIIPEVMSNQTEFKVDDVLNPEVFQMKLRERIVNEMRQLGLSDNSNELVLDIDDGQKISLKLEIKNSGWFISFQDSNNLFDTGKQLNYTKDGGFSSNFKKDGGIALEDISNEEASQQVDTVFKYLNKFNKNINDSTPSDTNKSAIDVSAVAVDEANKDTQEINDQRLERLSNQAKDYLDNFETANGKGFNSLYKKLKEILNSDQTYEDGIQGEKLQPLLKNLQVLLNLMTNSLDPEFEKIAQEANLKLDEFIQLGKKNSFNGDILERAIDIIHNGLINLEKKSY